MVKIIKYEDLLLYTLYTQTLNQLSPFAGFRLPPSGRSTYKTYRLKTYHNKTYQNKTYHNKTYNKIKHIKIKHINSTHINLKHINDKTYYEQNI